MNNKIKSRYIRDIRNPSLYLSPHKQMIQLPSFEFLDEEEIEYDFAQHKRDTQKLYEMQKKCEKDGDFINLNKLQIRSGNHD